MLGRVIFSAFLLRKLKLREVRVMSKDQEVQASTEGSNSTSRDPGLPYLLEEIQSFKFRTRFCLESLVHR